MKKKSLNKISLVLAVASSVTFFRGNIFSKNMYYQNIKPLLNFPEDSTKKDTTKPKQEKYNPSNTPSYKPQDRLENQYIYDGSNSSLLRLDPTNIKTNLTIDDSLKNYEISEKVGDFYYVSPTNISFQDFMELEKKKQVNHYWKQISGGAEGDDALSSDRLIPIIPLAPTFDRIFGGNFVDIRPVGSVTVSFGGAWRRVFNPAFTKALQRNGTFDFDQNITLNMNGTVGEKLKIGMNWNTGAQFEWENNVKIDYTGFIEEIIQDVDAGNVSMPLPTQLISAGQNLFGFKTEMKFGRLYWTSVISIQRGQTEEIEIENGATNRRFDIRAAEYEENRHFFLSQYFRDKYEQALKSLPNIITDVQITRVEVYVMNRTQTTENLRNIAAFMDLGEPRPYRNQFGGGGLHAGNQANTLYQSLLANSQDTRSVDRYSSYLSSLNLQKSQDYEFVSAAKKLDPKEFDFHPQLGYITLRRQLQDNDMLAVAFEYTVNGVNYKVGELPEDYQNLENDEIVFLKLIRPGSINISLPTWNLMMKNVYNLGTSQVNRDNFRLRIVYKDDRTGIDNPSLVEGPIKDIPLVSVMGLDKVNRNGDRQPDSFFDFVDKGGQGNFHPVTIDAYNGRVYFPVLEPFGNHLKEELGGDQGDPTLIRKYVYDRLYRDTRNAAEQEANKNKFIITGTYQSASTNEIMLPGINIQQGSVRVLAGSTPLQEGIDYEVNYSLGRVKILNQGVLSSGQKIKVQYEKTDLINARPRTLFVNRFDYKISENFNIGATHVKLRERPFMPKLQIDDEPISNGMVGADINYSTESMLLTKVVDKIPLIDTKEKSFIKLSGEFAKIMPGHSKAVEVDNDGQGVAYIDDFEGTEISYMLSGNQGTVKKWKLSSTPQRFKESTSNNLDYAYGRAKLAWYTIDPSVYGNLGTGATKPEFAEGELDNHYVRQVIEQEVFPGKDPNAFNNRLFTFDLAYFPEERGQYNYDISNINPQTGKFINPRERWAGIMRFNEYGVNFDQENVEYIEFWLMDPFADSFNDINENGLPVSIQNTTGGKMYLNIGSVSEDVMPDDRFAFEHGLPTTSELESVEFTKWGKVTKLPILTNAFSNDPGVRGIQDVGLDGLSSPQELAYFDSVFVSQLPDEVKRKIEADPSSDDFKFFLGDDWDELKAPVVSRYKNFNNMEANSPESADQNSEPARGYTNLPDKEDLNNDNTVTSTESYFEYEIDIKPNMQKGDRYIVDIVDSDKGVRWYQFRIPIRDPIGRTNVNNIPGFTNIQYTRLYLTEWQQPVVLRMANLQYVEAQWRRVVEDLRENQVGPQPTPEQTYFNVSSVNIEENAQNTPSNGVGYQIPPGIPRQQDLSNPTVVRRMNEQSLNLCVDDLQPGDARGVYKNTRFNLVNYERVKMFVHAHDEETKDGELLAFIRLGIDQTLNYYEYEIPLKMTAIGETDVDLVWPVENRLEVTLNDLVELKRRRGANFSYDSIYVEIIDGKKYKVKGNPDLSEVNVIMVGVRNPGTGKDINGNITGDKKSACVWFNELRMNGFNEKGGWAAIGSMNTRLADFATVNISGSHRHIGFGSINQALNQRALENTTSFDINSTVLLNKFFPTKWNLQIPMYVGYSQNIIAPKFDPLSPDTEMQKSLQYKRQEEGDSAATAYKRMTNDITIQQSMSFNNVKKAPAQNVKIKTPLDISNFDFTYSYANQQRYNVLTEYNNTVRRNGAINYGYTLQSKPIEPLKKLKVKSKYFAPIKSINFNPLPSNLSFRTELFRYYNEELIRSEDQFGRLSSVGIAPNYDKRIDFIRQYGMKWNVTKSISLDYTSRANAAVDEIAGRVNKRDDDYDVKLKVITDNLKGLGRNKSFDQSINANYQLPIDKIPLTDWISSSVSYRANYAWNAGPVSIDPFGIVSFDTLGNTIQNGNVKTLNTSFSFDKLYNKSKFLKAINSPRKAPAKPANKNTTSGKEEDKKKDEKKPTNKFIEHTFRTLMMVKSVSANFNLTEGTTIPGYMRNVKFFGLDNSWNYPGLPFILGIQNDSISNELSREGLLTDKYSFNQPTRINNNFDGNYRATVEPFRDFKIQLTARHNWNNSMSYIYKDTLRSDFERQFADLNMMNSGSYSTSYIGLNTMFVKNYSYTDSSGKINSPVFDKFIKNRSETQKILNDYNKNDVDSAHYGINGQDVLIPSFLHAYTNRDMSEFDPKKGEKNIFPTIPLPNWTINYRGLSKLSFIKKYFTSVDLSHAYNGTYRVAGYNTSLEYSRAGKENFTGENYYNQNIGAAPGINILNNENQYVPYFLITNITIQERMANGIEFKTKSKMSFKIDYNKERNLSLSMTNAQVTEMKRDDITVTYGFVKKGLTLPKQFNFLNKGREIIFKNEMNIRAGISLADNATFQRGLDGRSTRTAGTYTLRFNPTIDYDINAKLSLQLYFTRSIMIPYISNSFKNTSTEFGGRLRFLLS